MNGNNEHNDDALRWQLHALRRDIEPDRDLWPDIAARIAAAPQAARVRRKRPTWLPMALAASLLLAFGAFWRFGTTPPTPAGDPLIRSEAAALSRQYQDAFDELARGASASEPGQSDFAAAIHNLDQGAAQIRAAIERSPDSRFLLEQLRRTYARRLALTQRAALT